MRSKIRQFLSAPNTDTVLKWPIWTPGLRGGLELAKPKISVLWRTEMVPFPHILTHNVSTLAPPADGNRAGGADLDARIKSAAAKESDRTRSPQLSSPWESPLEAKSFPKGWIGLESKFCRVLGVWALRLAGRARPPKNRTEPTLRT